MWFILFMGKIDVNIAYALLAKMVFILNDGYFCYLMHKLFIITLLYLAIPLIY